MIQQIRRGSLGNGDCNPGEIPSIATAIRFLQEIVSLPDRRTECFHAIYFAADGHFLADRGHGRGEVGMLRLRLRELYSHAFALGATAMIVAHNHPSGICRPSAADIRETRRMNEIGRALDIELLDHLIFARDRVYSMRAGGLL
ncbi:MAG: DNA repair protein [Sphingomonadales bacterium]|nr:MAG: DNA repair protein [Sphingomonadales bacterium]